MTTRALYLRLSRLVFDDALTCGRYALVYAPDTVGEDYAMYTLYHRQTFVTRWRVKDWRRLEAVRKQVQDGLSWITGEWTFAEGGGMDFVSDEDVPEQLTLWAA